MIGEKYLVIFISFCFSFSMDVDDVKFVINFDYPTNSEDYVHRIGRTGRQCKTGTAYTFFTPANANKARDLISVLQEANQVVNPKLMELAQGGGGYQKRSRGGGRRDDYGGGRGGGGRGGRGGGRFNRDEDRGGRDADRRPSKFSAGGGAANGYGQSSNYNSQHQQGGYEAYKSGRDGGGRGGQGGGGRGGQGGGGRGGQGGGGRGGQGGGGRGGQIGGEDRTQKFNQSSSQSGQSGPQQQNNYPPSLMNYGQSGGYSQPPPMQGQYGGYSGYGPPVPPNMARPPPPPPLMK